MDEDPDAGFHRLVGGLDYPMFVVTTAAGGRRAGCLVGFTTQCSIRPVRFVVYLSRKNFTYRVAQEAEHLGMHVLRADDRALAELFGHETGDEVDKLARCRWRARAGGVPIIDGCRGWFVGRIVGRVDGGDHVGFVLEPVAAAVEGEPGLGFQAVKGTEPGHEP